jgi:hypothetical protein
MSIAWPAATRGSMRADPTLPRHPFSLLETAAFLRSSSTQTALLLSTKCLDRVVCLSLAPSRFFRSDRILLPLPTPKRKQRSLSLIRYIRSAYLPDLW